MKKLIVFALLLLALTAIVAAYGMRTGNVMETGNRMNRGMYDMHGMMYGQNGMHEKMMDIMEDGSYSDLVKLRDELGINIKPFIKSEDDFKKMQEMHNEMHGSYGQMSHEEMHERMHSGNSGCQMMQSSSSK